MKVLSRYPDVNFSDENDPTYLCHPIIYFYLHQRKLNVVGIQLSNDESDPFFTPKDKYYDKDEIYFISLSF